MARGMRGANQVINATAPLTWWSA